MSIHFSKKCQKKSSPGYLGKIGIFAATSLVAASAVYFYSPVSETHAETVGATATVNQVVSLQLDANDIGLNFTSPTLAGTFESGNVTATVTTNSNGGYELHFSSINNETDMVGTGSDVIKSDFSGTVTSDNMAVNKWGYSLNGTDFSKIPALSNIAIFRNIDHTPSAAEASTKVYIGAKVNTEISAGIYKKSLLFTAVAHEPIVPTMQNFDKDSLAAGKSTLLKDSRDGNMYTVKKLADGNVWMTENLRIVNKTISSADSNLPAGETYTIPASNITSFAGDVDANAVYLDSTYGGYYNFYTVTAGWGTESTTSGNSPKDICPKGWRLPTGGEGGEFQTLYNNYNSVALMQDAPGFLTSGGFADNGKINGMESGFYWSSTVTNDSLSRRLRISSTTVDPTYSSTRRGGENVRCVAI